MGDRSTTTEKEANKTSVMMTNPDSAAPREAEKTKPLNYLEQEVVYTGGRPFVTPNVTPPRFQVSDTVYLLTPDGGSRNGPYLVARVHTESTPAKYTLNLEDGTQVNAGLAVEESCLVAET